MCVCVGKVVDWRSSHEFGLGAVGCPREVPWAQRKLDFGWKRSVQPDTIPPPLLMSATPSEGQTRDQWRWWGGWVWCGVCTASEGCRWSVSTDANLGGPSVHIHDPSSLEEGGGAPRAGEVPPRSSRLPPGPGAAHEQRHLCNSRRRWELASCPTTGLSPDMGTGVPGFAPGQVRVRVQAQWRPSWGRGPEEEATGSADSPGRALAWELECRWWWARAAQKGCGQERAS